jgi:hypothetical protein
LRIVAEIPVLLHQPTYTNRGIKMDKKRERGPNTRELQYSISVVHAALEVLREKAGMTNEEFEKATDVMFDKMFPKAATKEEVTI